MTIYFPSKFKGTEEPNVYFIQSSRFFKSSSVHLVRRKEDNKCYLIHYLDSSPEIVTYCVPLKNFSSNVIDSANFSMSYL